MHMLSSIQACIAPLYVNLITRGKIIFTTNCYSSHSISSQCGYDSVGEYLSVDDLASVFYMLRNDGINEPIV